MREILFRGKRLDNGEWVEGAFMPANDTYPATIFHDRRHACGEYVDQNTVGQYTGLTDKNGKKIFEGDIWDCGGCIGVIKWVDEGCSFEAHYVMYGIEYTNAVSDYRAAKVEVIGSIHDNPELIGGDTP